MSTSQFWVNQNAATRILGAFMLEIDHISLETSLELGSFRSETLALNQEINMTIMLVKAAEIQPNLESERVPIILKLQTLLNSVVESSTDSGSSTFFLSSILQASSPDVVVSQLKQADIVAASDSIKNLRREISLANKELATLLYSGDISMAIEEPDTAHRDGQLFTGILKRFYQSPFALEFSSEFLLPIERTEGIAKQYQGLMAQLSQSWLLRFCQGSLTPTTLVRAEVALLRQLWRVTVEQLRNMDLVWADSQQVQRQKAKISIEELDQGLRDTLYREGTATNIAVFVGAQNSGKSTLLNRIIGSEVLPVGGEVNHFHFSYASHNF
jgi:hypothetical protein